MAGAPLCASTRRRGQVFARRTKIYRGPSRSARARASGVDVLALLERASQAAELPACATVLASSSNSAIERSAQLAAALAAAGAGVLRIEALGEHS